MAMVTMHELLMVKAEILQEIRTLITTTSPKIPQRQWLKTWEVKEMLGISLGTLRNMRKNGKIEYTKVGGLLLYNYNHIMQLIEKNKKHIKNPINRTHAFPYNKTQNKEHKTYNSKPMTNNP